jgi:hypothetical protein
MSRGRFVEVSGVASPDDSPNGEFNITAVPEPTTLAWGGLGGLRRSQLPVAGSKRLIFTRSALEYWSGVLFYGNSKRRMATFGFFTSRFLSTRNVLQVVGMRL